MKAGMTLTAWTIVAVVVVFAAVRPDSGVIFQSPMAAVAVGLIGYGLCLDARQRRATS